MTNHFAAVPSPVSQPGCALWASPSEVGPHMDLCPLRQVCESQQCVTQPRVFLKTLKTPLFFFSLSLFFLFEIPKPQTKNLLAIAITHESSKKKIPIFLKASPCPSSVYDFFVGQLLKVWVPPVPCRHIPCPAVASLTLP